MNTTGLVCGEVCCGENSPIHTCASTDEDLGVEMAVGD